MMVYSYIIRKLSDHYKSKYTLLWNNNNQNTHIEKYKGECALWQNGLNCNEALTFERLLYQNTII